MACGHTGSEKDSRWRALGVLEAAAGPKGKIVKSLILYTFEAGLFEGSTVPGGSIFGAYQGLGLCAGAKMEQRPARALGLDC
jgi:hypothetical protein